MQERYARNLGPLTEQDCLLLQKRRVFLAGCGGLGGYLLEHLLRVGVGTITVCDGDRFTPSNLNRQLLADAASLGRSKAECACERAALVNPQVTGKGRSHLPDSRKCRLPDCRPPSGPGRSGQPVRPARPGQSLLPGGYPLGARGHSGMVCPGGGDPAGRAV